MPFESLTHCTVDGRPYQREPIVERQIAEALTLPADDLRRQLAVIDQQSPAFLKEECLVYLIRHYERAGDYRQVNDLTQALLARSAPLIHSHLRRLPLEAAQDGTSDVIKRLFEQMLDFGSDRGDFLQVHFGSALEKLTIRAFQEQLKLLRQRLQEVPLSSLAGYDDDDAENDQQSVQPGVVTAIVTPSAESIAIENDQIRDALSRLEEPYLSVFLLRHYGWPIEAQDPHEPTISRQFGKDPRTIRNWLKKADAVLEQWRGEQRGESQ